MQWLANTGLFPARQGASTLVFHAASLPEASIDIRWVGVEQGSDVSTALVRCPQCVSHKLSELQFSCCPDSAGG